MFEEAGEHDVDHDRPVKHDELLIYMSGQLLTVSMPDGNMKTITLPKDIVTIDSAC